MAKGRALTPLFSPFPHACPLRSPAPIEISRSWAPRRACTSDIDPRRGQATPQVGPALGPPACLLWAGTLMAMNTIVAMYAVQ